MAFGDALVGLIAVIMVAAILYRNDALRRLPLRRKVIYGVVWAGIFAIGAVLAGHLSG